jgi:hypothetical protein
MGIQQMGLNGMHIADFPDEVRKAFPGKTSSPALRQGISPQGKSQ